MGRQRPGPRKNPVWFHVSAESTEGLEERRPSPGDLGTILYNEPPSPFPPHRLSLMEEDSPCLSKLFYVMVDVNEYTLLRVNQDSFLFIPWEGVPRKGNLFSPLAWRTPGFYDM